MLCISTNYLTILLQFKKKLDRFHKKGLKHEEDFKF